MRHARRIAAVGLAVLFAGLVVLIPARVVHALLSPEALRLAGIEGTVWNGRAAEAQVGGSYLRNVEWSIKPLELFAGRLGVDLKAEPPGGFLESDLRVSAGGRLAVDTLRAALPLAALDGLLPLGDVSGNLTLNLADVVVEDGWPLSLAGEAGVSDLTVRPLATAPLGSFRADFQTADSAIVGAVEDVSGMLDVAATLTLTRDRGYALTGRVGPTPTAAPSLVEQLRFLGSPDARGLREFRIEGTL